MVYEVTVRFSSFRDDEPDLFLTEEIGSDDWSFDDYWDDIGDTISCLIATAERKLSQIFPNGHDYNLSEARAIYLEDDEE